MFNIHNNHLWAQDNPYAICECQYQVHFSVSIWAGFIMDPYLLPERLTAQWYHDILGTILLELLQDVPLAMRQRLQFLHDRPPVCYGEDDWQWLNTTISRKVDWMSRVAFMAFLVTRSNSNEFVLIRTPEGACLCNPHPGLSKISWKPSGSCRCQHVKVCLTKCCVAHCHLPSASNTYYNYAVPMHLCHMMVTCILKTEVRGHRSYNISTCFFFNKASQYGVPVRGFCFTPYICICVHVCTHAYVCSICILNSTMNLVFTVSNN